MTTNGLTNPSSILKFNPITSELDRPVLKLVSRNGDYVGIIEYENLNVSLTANGVDEISFDVRKYVDGVKNELWDNLVGLRIVEYVGYGRFEADFTTNDDKETVKTATCQSLEVELGQQYLREFHVNDETDIARTDYSPTYIYDEDDLEHSVLYRAIKDKAPKWSINHVDDLLCVNNKVYPTNTYQRTFTVDGSTIYDFLTGDLCKECNCVILFDTLKREINLYNIKDYVYKLDTMEVVIGAYKSGGVMYDKDGNVLSDSDYGFCDGVGEDTVLYIDKSQLANSFNVGGDNDSVKNCFYVKGGDDTITNFVPVATIGGDNYIYLFDKFQTDDMPSALSEALDDYAEMCNTNKDTYFKVGGVYVYDSTCTYDSTTKTCRNANNKIITEAIYDNSKVYVLNTLCHKEQVWQSDAGSGHCNYIDKYYDKYDTLIGQSASYEAETNVDTDSESTNGNVIYKVGGIFTKYCNMTDRSNYLTSGRFPNVETADTTASTVATSIKNYFATATNKVYLKVAWTTTSFVTVTNTAEAMLKVKCDSRYDLKINKTSTSPTCTNSSGVGVWTGNITVTNSVDKTDTYTETVTVNVYLIDDTVASQLDLYNKQKLAIAVAKQDIKDLDLSSYTTSTQLIAYFSQYNQVTLDSYCKCFDSCLSTLRDLYANCSDLSDVYTTLNTRYKLYYDSCKSAYDSISNEIMFLFTNINLQTASIGRFQASMSLKSYLDNIDTDLYPIFRTFVREDEYSNSNYISEGLSDTECIRKARELVHVAEENLKSACVLQKTVSGDLNNIFADKDYSSLKDKFALFNYIRCGIDDKIYKLRLTQIGFHDGDLSKINVTFSDEVYDIDDNFDDIRNILSQASNIATTYSSTVQQSLQGTTAMSELNDMRKDGLSSVDFVISNSDDEEVMQDRSGLLLRSMSDIGAYGNHQTRITGNGIYLTDSAWQDEPRMALGLTKINDVWQYGVVADTIVGKLIVGESLEIEDDNGYVKINGNGISINGGSLNLTNGNYSVEIDPNHEDSNTKNGYLMCIRNGEDILMGVDTDGYGYFKGGLEAGGVSIGRTGNFYGEFYPTAEQGCGLILNFYPPNVINSSLYDCYLSIKNGIGELKDDRGIKFVNKYSSNNYGVDLSINENKIEYNTLNWNRNDLTTKATFTDKSICFDCKTNSGTNINSINVKSLIPEICLSVENSSVNEARTISMNCTQNKIYINNSKYQSNPIGIKGALVGDGNKEAFFIHGKDVSTNHYHSSGSLSNGQGKSISVETNKMYFIITQSWVGGSAFGMFAIMPTSGNYVTTIQSADGVSITTSNANTIDIQNTGVPSVAYKIIEIDFYL